ncbi:hypothetical protein IRP63_09280 [Clostridium botulinum]|uniref:Uncharacterized protein n=1 Tax=Clostridium botulinum C/D str. DC5 TaxID=1443128 RepID=A0A0A0IG49_CLOBO|nr:hypothetical protein [Clostridium botulinum]KGM93598.1 hypothetical protein Z956_11075 [Clostridium botulinum D str. CCUG 7971]KGM99533.1 hypothetical protein Z955_06795 [Clostridium botulinum C/D str. DC5]KOC48879.1 hypothetical protein ADU88_07310 [Clostridium botulinum]KOC55830.1 hypothetical protein ADU90_10175 [Clostridium botulinum]KOC56429.1 hypothetical protein ADU89_03005 [Clostridium botulinum]
MSFDREDTFEKSIYENYDMVPINTYIKQMNNHSMFQQLPRQYENNYQIPQQNYDMSVNNEIKPMTYYKIDHSLIDDSVEDNYGFRNLNLPNNYGMRMMEEDDEYSDDKSRELDYDDFVDVNNMLMKIERYNPGIFQFLRRYNMSYEDAKKIIKKIITVTLMYEND